MNTLLSEPAVLDLMRQEHIKAAAKAEELWAKVQEAEAAMEPLKAAYERILHEWSDADCLAESLAACLKAKEPQQQSEAA